MRMRLVIGVLGILALLSTASAELNSTRGGAREIGIPKTATLYSAPLVNSALLGGRGPATVACSVLNLGNIPVTVTVEICDASGVCAVPGFGCSGISLQPEHVCDTSNVAISPDQALYCRVLVSGFAPFNLRGAFQLVSGDDVSAAVEVR